MGKLFLTVEEGVLRIRLTSSGESLRALKFAFESFVLGPKDRYLLVCGSTIKATLLDLETWGMWQREARCGAFDQAGERIVLVSQDKKRLSLHQIAAPERDWEVPLEVEAPTVGQFAPAFFSSCGEFIGIRDDSQQEAVTRAFRADTGAEASLQGVEFPPPEERLATSSGPAWPPGTVVEPWQRP
jgi:hypothetical protein